MADVGALVGDLRDEQDALDGELTAGLDERGTDVLDLATPAKGWTVADQLSHLAGFDEAATTAVVRPDDFNADLERRLAEGDHPVTGYTERGRQMSGLEVLDWWRTSRAELLAALATMDPRARVPWYGPPMSAMSFVTARIMETWAHGQDIRDAMGLAPQAGPRLRHVAHIGVGARPFSFTIRDLPAPELPIDVVLEAPDGSTWSWGPGDAADRVSGPAVDFCLAVTQRRHLDDVHLDIVGPAATKWMSIAQAFAGPPGPGRAPL
ncbi:MAG TPA: TIGR03084 family metal-binding protein [Microthrixaceae bacterium]|nr:TIGR03084 family metal-binding protein [Microthrixaceae bacterium]